MDTWINSMDKIIGDIKNTIAHVNMKSAKISDVTTELPISHGTSKAKNDTCLIQVDKTSSKTALDNRRKHELKNLITCYEKCVNTLNIDGLPMSDIRALNILCPPPSIEILNWAKENLAHVNGRINNIIDPKNISQKNVVYQKEKHIKNSINLINNKKVEIYRQKQQPSGKFNNSIPHTVFNTTNNAKNVSNALSVINNQNQVQVTNSIKENTREKKIEINRDTKTTTENQITSTINTNESLMKSNKLANPDVHSKINDKTIVCKQNLTPTGYNLKKEIGPSLSFENFKNHINKMKEEKKTFTISGEFTALRNSLLLRGWIEKINIFLTFNKNLLNETQSWSNEELFQKSKNTDFEKYRKVLIYRLLQAHQVDYFWTYGSNAYTINSDKAKPTVINQYPTGSCILNGTKTDLYYLLSESHWFAIDGFSNVNYPRTYDLSLEYEVKEFTRDFRMTACVSLLKWIVIKAPLCHTETVSINGDIPTAVFIFAILQCHSYLKIKSHKDIDEDDKNIKDEDWDMFLDSYYKLVHNSGHFKFSNQLTKAQMVEQSRSILKKIEKYWPHMIIDGVNDLWILKPNGGCRGYGVIVCRTLKYILESIKNCKQVKYVIQKYIERPLLVHNTKFDIRQYFLITHRPYLQLWMYKDSYFKFSSQVFQLDKLDQSIHVTNYTVQRNYKLNLGTKAIPTYKMWHSDTFKKYLCDIGVPNAWENCIYKGMKEALVTITLCCQDRLYPRVNSFELWGADFMLSDDYKPFLIEVNNRPDLTDSTPITGALCPLVMEDVIKVTVDYPNDPNCSTGRFELIYKDWKLPSLAEQCASLKVYGRDCFPKNKDIRPQTSF